ncbi:hypothetical protein ARMSODRAFT_1024445 [Armillaria solidipes]|uniref:Uncharacterized protein n=1 Tax=Armillaria solidipes TaxID=1076256 RepID=A0A2H3BA03_9AGAR|nr:hypothetical protein ARMSODRAFT_1024445 [Armillaria solidipes]
MAKEAPLRERLDARFLPHHCPVLRRCLHAYLLHAAGRFLSEEESPHGSARQPFVVVPFRPPSDAECRILTPDTIMTAISMDSLSSFPRPDHEPANQLHIIPEGISAGISSHTSPLALSGLLLDSNIPFLQAGSQLPSSGVEQQKEQRILLFDFVLEGWKPDA